MNDSLNSRNKVAVTIEGIFPGYFCSDTVFNLSKKVLTETEIKILEKGLDYAPIQKSINLNPEVTFRNFVQEYGSSGTFETNQPMAFAKHLTLSKNLSAFSRIESELFKIANKELGYSDLLSEEWKALQSLTDDKRIVTGKTPFFVIGPFCTHHSICLNIGF